MYINSKKDFDFFIKKIETNEYINNFSFEDRINIVYLIAEKLKIFSLKERQPEILDLCKFFIECCDKYSIWLKKQTEKKDTRGIVYHIPSSNIPLMPFYSWIPSFIVGNANIIRISNKSNKEYLNQIIDIIDNVILQKEKLRQIFFEDDEFNTNSILASSVCKVRILWGNNKTIQKIKQSQFSNCSMDISFNTRFSASLIDCTKYLEMTQEELIKLSKLLINDTLNLSFNACSSPQIIYFLGDINQYEKVRISLESLLSNNKIKMNSDLALISTENILKIQGDIVLNKRDEKASKFIFGRPILEINNHSVKNLNLDLLTNTTLFIQSNSIEEILLYWQSNIQTLTYMKNCRLEELKKLRNSLGGIGPDRIVPIGNALKFDVIWDGINLFEVLTRESTIYV